MHANDHYHSAKNKCVCGVCARVRVCVVCVCVCVFVVCVCACVCVCVCLCEDPKKFAERLNTHYDRSKTAEECGIFQLSVQHNNIMQDVHVELNPGLLWQKQHST